MSSLTSLEEDNNEFSPPPPPPPPSPSPRKRKRRRVALITGAGSGIGRAATRALYRDGYCVVLAGRRLENLRETVQEDWDETRYLLQATDVTQPDQVQALFRACQEGFERLDVLFNNAGVGSPAIPFDEIEYAAFEQVLQTNVTGSFLCSQQAWRIMKEQEPQQQHSKEGEDGGGGGGRGGRIINNGSISAHTPRPLSAPYTMAKHAITGLTRSLNLDGRSVHISCSQIDIGNAETPITARMSSEGALQPNGQVVVEPTISVSVVADTIVYLANLPYNVNVPFLTMMAHQMPYMGRG